MRPILKLYKSAEHISLGSALLLLLPCAEPIFPQQPTDSFISNNHIFQATLHELIQAARNNPQLLAAEAKITAASASVNIQKGLDPPQVGMEFYQSPVSAFPNPFKNQMEYDYSVQQMIPFPGKRGTMAEAQRKRTEMLKADRQTREQDIIHDVKALYFELYLKDRQMEINRESQTLVRSIIAIARNQYEAGRGTLSDVLRAQTESSSLVNDSIVLKQQRKSMEGMLNAFVNRPVTIGIDFIHEIDPVIPGYDLDVLLAAAEKNRPELKSMQADIEMQEAERLAVRKEYLPDLMVRGTYKQMMQASDDWGLMIGATLPVAPWSSGKYSAGTKRTDANISVARSERNNMKNMIASEVNDALLKAESGKERLKFSKETALPQARHALESAYAAYGAGKQEFLMLIDIQKMLVMAKLDYHMAVMTLLDSQNRLERAVGTGMNEIEKAVERENR